MYFFSLQVSNGEYSCYVDLKSFYSVKSSAEYLARIFALKNSGQEGSRKRPKGLVKSCWTTCLLLSSRLLSRHYYGPLTYAASSQAPLLLSLTKESFSKAGFIWKEPFRRKLYISSLKKLFLRKRKNLIQLPFSFLKVEHDLSIKFVFRMIIKKPSLPG